MNAVGKVALGVVAFLLLIALPIGVWAFSVATSDIKGHGDSVVQKNSATNRTGSQAQFERLYQEVRVADQRLDVAADAVKADTDSQVAQTNLTGARSYCLQVVGDYNALARTWTAQDFRAADLPSQIDSLNPDTDCKENNA